METGVVGQFRWLESADADFLKILKLCPEVLIGKCVVISCFDSGPLRATEEELAKGWQQQGDLVIVPCVDSISDLPYDNYDEWYVFSEKTKPEIPDVFVNECLTLRSQESLVTEAIAVMGRQTDIVGARCFASVSGERQVQFWDQLDRISPESYIGCGDHLIFVSRNAHLFELVLKTLVDEPSTMDRMMASTCSQEEFVLLYSKLLEECHPGIRILMTGPLELEMTFENGEKSSTNLHNLWIQWGNAEDRKELVDRHISAMLATVDPKLPIERRQIIPIIKDSIYIPDYGKKMIFEHYVADLYCVYAIDWEDRTETLGIEQMTELGLERSDLRDVAIENLQVILPAAECHGEGPWYILSAGTDYVASLLLFDGVWDQLEEMVDGDIVAVVPARDTLLFTGSNSSEGVAFIREEATDICTRGHHLISNTLLRRQSGRWVAFDSDEVAGGHIN